jgi:hypothetical protein
VDVKRLAAPHTSTGFWKRTTCAEPSESRWN